MLDIAKLAQFSVALDFIMDETDFIPDDPELAMMTLPLFVKNVNLNLDEKGANDFAMMITGKGIEGNVAPFLMNPFISQENSQLVYDWVISSLGSNKAFLNMSFDNPMKIMDLVPYFMSDWSNMAGLGKIDSNLK